jgi:hypothetical protein
MPRHKKIIDKNINNNENSDFISNETMLTRAKKNKVKNF